MSEQQNGLSETVQKGLNAANAVRGAIKTGKAIAGAAKGASVGGAAGAAIGFAWENRKVLTAIIIGCVALLLLPVMIICMLPSLIFGGLDNADALNNSSVIQQNIIEIHQSVTDILSENLNQVLEEIDTDRKPYGTGGSVVINPFSEGFDIQINEIIANFCAMQNSDPQKCTKEEFINFLQGYADTLFTYEKEEKENTIMSEMVIVDTETGETTKEILTKTEITYVYTVIYCDIPFELTEEQKAVARDYAENLKNFIEYGV